MGIGVCVCECVGLCVCVCVCVCADRMNAVEAFRNLIKTRAPHISCSMGKCVCSFQVITELFIFHGVYMDFCQ